MFWGLVLEPCKRYTQKVQQSFHISQAALELSTSELEPVQLILEYDGANYVLATLNKKCNLYQVPLDLNFNTGDQISFRTIGKGRVHLTGYHILEDDLEDMVLNGEEESDVEEEKIPEKSDSLLEKLQTKRKKPDSNKSTNNKKSKLSLKNESENNESSEDDSDEDDGSGEDLGSDLMDSDYGEEDEDEEDDEEMELDEEDEDDDEDEEDESEDEEDETEVKKKAPPSASKHNKSDVSINGKTPKNKKMPDSTKVTPKSGKKNNSLIGKDSKENKTPKSEKKSPKGEKRQDQNKTPESTPQKKVLEGGVVIEELKLGEGQVAKPGKMAQVYYVGRLQSNKKQFDSTTQGPGFKFRLGKGEVIRGWDIGVNGMKVGGKRRITIPSQLAYGAKGSPPAIPPNSALIFEVELKGLH